MATEFFGNIRTVKAFATEKEGIEAFDDKNVGTFQIGRT